MAAGPLTALLPAETVDCQGSTFGGRWLKREDRKGAPVLGDALRRGFDRFCVALSNLGRARQLLKKIRGPIAVTPQPKMG